MSINEKSDTSVNHSLRSPMSAESPAELESEIRWPDPERGPYLISVRFRASAEDWRAVGLGLGFAVEPEARSLRTSDLRKLRLPLIIEQAAAKLRAVPSGAGVLQQLADELILGAGSRYQPPLY
jgi:hypothetical protein